MEPCYLYGISSMSCNITELMLQGDVKKVTDDVAALKPSIFAAVPRVLDRMKSGIEAKIKKQPGWRQAIFRTAYNIKRFMRRLGRFDLVRAESESVLALLGLGRFSVHCMQ